MVNIKGISKAKVLKALYDNSRPLGMGFLHYIPGPMPLEEAENLVNLVPNLYFDYVRGRVIKADISGDELRPYLYDRDNGEGAAQRAIDGILP